MTSAAHNPECASPIRKTETSSALRLEWDNRQAKSDGCLLWFLVVFWLLWAPITIFATFLIFVSDAKVFLSIWCIFGWFGTLGIPFALLQRRWTEWVEFSEESIVCGQSGFLAWKPKAIPLNLISEIVIGHFEPGDPESVVTLNMIHQSRWRKKDRKMLGYWLHPDLKHEVFNELKRYAASRNIELGFGRY